MKQFDGENFKQRCKVEFTADPALQREFAGDFEAYFAYRQATEAGLVKRLGRQEARR